VLTLLELATGVPEAAAAQGGRIDLGCCLLLVGETELLCLSLRWGRNVRNSREKVVFFFDVDAWLSNEPKY
jgi:hypothetical protein